MFYLLPIIAFLLSVILTRLAIPFLQSLKITDRQEAHSTHIIPTPRGGGLVIYLVFVALVLLFIPWSKALLGFLLGGTLVLLINFADDRYNISPWTRLLVELVAAGFVVAAGIGMEHITNPLTGAAIPLYHWNVTLPWLGWTITPWMDLFTVVWILVMVNMVNWVDGLDGLASGISIIAALTLFGLSLLSFVNQPDMAKMALILAGAVGGFLVWNFNPAKIKLGDAGSTFLGFTLAVLAIFSSGKIAVFFLVLGLPFLDLFWVISRRVFIEKKSPFRGDTKHFHHRLLKAGLSVRQVVLIYYVFCAAFGVVALTLQGAQQKLLAIFVMTLLMVGFAWWAVKRGRGYRGKWR